MKVDGAVIVQVAPHAQDGLEALNTRRRAQRQLFSKKACKEPLKWFGDDQYHDDRGRNAWHFVEQPQLLTR